MDLSRLQRLDAYTWTVPLAAEERRAPVRLYGSEPLLVSMDDKVLEQITNVARLPGLIGAALTMPDAHWGYGFPIGGVAAFDPEQGGVVSAGGVGFDIACGIRCLRTNIPGEELHPHREPLADALFQAIPAGLGEEGPLELGPDELEAVLLDGAAWAVEHGYGARQDLE